MWKCRVWKCRLGRNSCIKVRWFPWGYRCLCSTSLCSGCCKCRCFWSPMNKRMRSEARHCFWVPGTQGCRISHQWRAANYNPWWTEFSSAWFPGDGHWWNSVRCTWGRECPSAWGTWCCQESECFSHPMLPISKIRYAVPAPARRRTCPNTPTLVPILTSSWWTSMAVSVCLQNPSTVLIFVSRSQ